MATKQQLNYTVLNNKLTQRGEDGFFQLKFDKQARDLFLEEVKEKSYLLNNYEVYNRYYYLVTNNFYYDVFSQYTVEQLEELDKLLYSYDFQFESFMAAQKFYKEYALKTNDKELYLENYEQHIAIVSLYLAQGNFEFAKEMAIAMIEQRYQPATPTFMNSGRARRGELVSCYLVEMDDSLNSINHNLSVVKQLSKMGGAIAVNLSKLRARGESIKEVEGVAKGVLPVAKLIEQSVGYADQLGQRPGAAAAYLNIFHWDVEEFLDSKKINSDENIRLSSLSIGLIVPSIFMKLAAENKPYFVFFPLTVFKATGKHLDDLDIDNEYENLINNPAIKKRELNAREMLIKIASIQKQSGYPYLMFKTNANKEHALKKIGEIKQSNLCTEIAQLQETSVITDYGEDDEIRRDISCNLGSINIVNVMESGKLAETVKTAMRALTAVSDLSSIKNAPGVKKANEELHSVGLGVMNLHGYLAKNQIAYESEEAKDFCRSFFAALNYYSIYESSTIAEERNIEFKDFEKSEYANGKYFYKYTIEDYLPHYEKVQKLFNFRLPHPEDWLGLSYDVQHYGMYHAYRLTVAPTGSISYVQNATAGVSPITDMIERRLQNNTETYYPMPYLSPETQWFYKSAYNMNQMKIIDLVAEIQPHIDQSISLTLHAASDTSTKEIAKWLVYAHHKGLKTLYYIRTSSLNAAECISCAI